ncbi:MAG: hypothetical protein ABI566_13780 [Pseudolysinimonas sp.]
MSENPPPVPPVPVPAAAAPSPRKSPVGWTVAGIIVLALSLFSFPRGLAQLIRAFVRPDQVDLAYALGYFLFGAALVALGIVFLVRAAKIRKQNRLLTP